MRFRYGIRNSHCDELQWAESNRVNNCEWVVLVTINNHRLSAIPAARRFKYVACFSLASEMGEARSLALESESESQFPILRFRPCPAMPAVSFVRTRSLSLSLSCCRGSFPQYLSISVPCICVLGWLARCVWVWVAGSFWFWLRGVGLLHSLSLSFQISLVLFLDTFLFPTHLMHSL